MPVIRGANVRTAAAMRVKTAAGAITHAIVALVVLTVAGDASAQNPRVPAPLFSSTEPIAFTLTTDLRQLLRDRDSTAAERPATITMRNLAGKDTSFPLQVRTRGNFRRTNCRFVPLRLNIAARQVRGTAFEGQDKLKLVTHCADDQLSEQYVLQEYLVYQVYNLLTEHSHRVRLAKVSYVDQARPGVLARHAIILESDEDMAARVGGSVVELRGATAAHLDPHHSALVGVFQYFIGNTDFSIFELHNVVLVGTGIEHFPIAYDFDHAGVINTRYARPPPILPIRSVTHRLHRGYCVTPAQLEPVLNLFREKKAAIYSLYRTLPGLDERHVTRALRYYDDFYKMIDDPRQVDRELIKSCVY